MPKLLLDRVYRGDAIKLMRKLRASSIHAVITDPPYGIEILGMKWDSFKAENGTKQPYQLWTTLWAKEAFRILKPGATMFAMGSTRTYHRMACGIENAGFIIKGCVLWCYNTGFPKAQDLGKMINGRLGAKRKIVGKYNEDMGGLGGKRLGTSKGDITLPASDLAKKWNGWKVGTLKPSYEPIVWAVKPPDGSYLENVLKHGVGAVNIDACRIGNEIIIVHDAPAGTFAGGKIGRGSIKNYRSREGRFPANMIRTDLFYDGRDKFYYIGSSTDINPFIFVPKPGRRERDDGLEGVTRPKHRKVLLDSKGFERFNTKVKNIHPTVKPTRLMEHLIKLVTRERQLVLDPFVGSGTTCVAAHRLNRHYLGFDKSPEYIKITRCRLAACKKKSSFHSGQ